MNPWTRAEISKAATVHGVGADDQRMHEFYDRFGPTARICFNFRDAGQLLAYKTHYQDALRELSFNKLDEMVSKGTTLSLDGGSNTLLLLKRVHKRDLIHAKEDVSKGLDFCYGSLEPITPLVEVELRKYLWNAALDAQIVLYKSLASVEGTRRIAGLVFEALAQRKFQIGIRLDLVPMALGSGQGTKRLPRWHSNHLHRANLTSIYIKPQSTEIYTALDQIKPMVYYVPEASNQVAFDAFIIADEKLFIFQFTIGSYHPIKEGIIPFFSKYSATLPQEVNWYFVFVVPPGPRSEVSCPQAQPRETELKELLGKMTLFSAVTDPTVKMMI
jgi:hypothetical protein